MPSILGRSWALSLCAGLALSTAARACDPAPTTVPPEQAPQAQSRQPVVQLAILLDTSNSMDGLINQARTQIWNVVSELATAKHSGKRPKLQVALYEYGKASIPAAEGHLRQILPFTDDLDEVSAQLFALTTNGGDEFCGRVIEAAATGLAWSPDKSDLKIMLIAGNEPFTQGPVDYKSAIPGAVKKGVVVNTIFCGSSAEGEQTNWKDGALLGEGTYTSIDTGATEAHIQTPYDAELARLNTELNATYIAYGTRGSERAITQGAQDSAAANAAPSAGLARIEAKASALYRNAAWDLVDAAKDGQKIDAITQAELPEIMRPMTPAQREAYVKAQGEKRTKIQDQIKDLAGKRGLAIAEEQKRLGTDASNTLKSAMLAAIKAQAARLGYQFEK